MSSVSSKGKGKEGLERRSVSKVGVQKEEKEEHTSTTLFASSKGKTSEGTLRSKWERSQRDWTEGEERRRTRRIPKSDFDRRER